MSVSPKLLRANIDTLLEVVRGNNITWEMTVKNIEDESVPDITGATITFSVKEKKTDSSTLFTRTTGGSGIVLNDPTNGKFRLSLIPSNTSSLTPKTYFFDIEMSLSGFIDTISLGTLEVIRDIKTS